MSELEVHVIKQWYDKKVKELEKVKDAARVAQHAARVAQLAMAKYVKLKSEARSNAPSRGAPATAPIAHSFRAAPVARRPAAALGAATQAPKARGAFVCPRLVWHSPILARRGKGWRRGKGCRLNTRALQKLCAPRKVRQWGAKRAVLLRLRQHGVSVPRAPPAREQIRPLRRAALMPVLTALGVTRACASDEDSVTEVMVDRRGAMMVGIALIAFVLAISYLLFQRLFKLCPRTSTQDVHTQTEGRAELFPTPASAASAAPVDASREGWRRRGNYIRVNQLYMVKFSPHAKCFHTADHCAGLNSATPSTMRPCTKCSANDLYELLP